MVEPEQIRTILQFMMVDKVLPDLEFSSLLGRVIDSYDFNEQTVVNEINKVIEPFSQKICKTVCEVSGEKVFILASTANHSDMKSVYSKDMLDYFFFVMDNIISSSGSLSKSNALAQNVTQNRILMLDAEKYLNRFTDDHLLVEHDGHLHLSPLALTELGAYITENYVVESCLLCKKIVVFGGQCVSCSKPLHFPCVKNYTKNNKQAKCPSCKKYISC